MKINNSPSFTGYSNLIASELTSPVEKYLFFTMKLDDIGSPDLTKFRELKRMQGLPEQVVNNDVLTILHSNLMGSMELLFFNDKRLLSGRKLRQLEQQADTVERYNIYKGKENFHMKVYTFLASLTRRMMNHNSEIVRDPDFYRVFGHAQHTISNILEDSRASEGFMISALNNSDNKPFQMLAKSLNDKIAGTMRIFFK